MIPETLKYSLMVKLNQFTASGVPVSAAVLANCVGLNERELRDTIEELRKTNLISSDQRGYWIPYNREQYFAGRHTWIKLAVSVLRTIRLQDKLAYDTFSGQLPLMTDDEKELLEICKSIKDERSGQMGLIP